MKTCVDVLYWLCWGFGAVLAVTGFFVWREIRRTRSEPTQEDEGWIVEDVRLAVVRTDREVKHG
ncbi:MAG: hypothetical protein U1E83_06790 [Methylotetracoccus sp.]